MRGDFPSRSKKDSRLRNARRLLREQYEKNGFIDMESGQSLLLEGAYDGNNPLVEELLNYGVPLDTADKATGMTALHLAVGRDHVHLAKILVERGASFMPDKQGRMPSTVAAECEVSEELCDFIAEAEAAAEARDEGV